MIYVAFCLVKWLEDVSQCLRVDSFPCIRYFDLQQISFAPYDHTHLPIFRGEFEGIGQKIVHNLHHIVGDKVHLYIVFREKL